MVRRRARCDSGLTRSCSSTVRVPNSSSSNPADPPVDVPGLLVKVDGAGTWILASRSARIRSTASSSTGRAPPPRPLPERLSLAASAARLLSAPAVRRSTHVSPTKPNDPPELSDRLNVARGPIVVTPSLSAVAFVALKPPRVCDRPEPRAPSVRVDVFFIVANVAATPNPLFLVAASTASNASAGTPCEDRDLAWKCDVFQSSAAPGALPCVSRSGSRARGGVATAVTSPAQPFNTRLLTYSVDYNGACV